MDQINCNIISNRYEMKDFGFMADDSKKNNEKYMQKIFGFKKNL